MRISVLATALSLCLVGLCSAQHANASIRKDTNIPAEGLGAALETLARNYDFQVLYRTEIVKDRKTHGAVGSLTSDEALTKVLSGTGLSYKYLDASTVTIVPVAMVTSGSITDQAQTSSNNTQDNSKEAGKKSSQDFRVAQSSSGENPGDSSVDKPKAEDQRDKVIPEILIKGSRTFNTDARRTEDDVQPYYSFSGETIQNSGALDIQDFFKQYVTMDTQAQTNNQSALSALGNVNSFNLRGAGANSTLILINGRRSMSGAFSGGSLSVDIDSIPLAAIDRIEVLPQSASAIYGASALGGVINVILKQSYEGGEVKLGYQNSGDGNAPARTLDAAYGMSLNSGRTNVMFAVHYSDSTPPEIGDRSFVQDYIRTVLKNNPSAAYSTFDPFLGATPNIGSASSNLTLLNGTPLNSSMTYIPAGTSPKTSTATLNAGLLANAGHYNLNFPQSAAEPTGLFFPIGAGSEVKSILATVRQEITENVEAFAEFTDRSNIAHTETDPLNGFVGYVPSGVPTNPFQQPVNVVFPDSEVAPINLNEISRRATGGLIFSLSNDWKAEADYTWNEVTFDYFIGTDDETALGNDIASGVLNPFVDTLAFPLNLSPYLGTATYGQKATLNDVGAHISGPLWKLPGGFAAINVGLEYRTERSGNGISNQVFPDAADNFEQLYAGQSQKVGSIYSELDLPVVSEANNITGLRGLDFQIAARFDTYRINAGTSSQYLTPSLVPFNTPLTEVESTVNSTNPTIGFRYKPVLGLMLRSSYSTAFLPPNFSQLAPDPIANPVTVVDPLRGDTTYSIKDIGGGNPNLQPVKSESWDAGIVLEPDFMHGFRLAIDWYRLTQRDRVASLSPQQIIDNENEFPGRVTRSAPAPGDPYGVGQITLVNSSLVNLTRAETNGYDITLGYHAQTHYGVFDLTALATVIDHFRTQNTINAPMLDIVNQVADAGPLKQRASATLAWRLRGWTASWATSYYGSYPQIAPPYTVDTSALLAQGRATIPSQIYHNLLVGYSIPTHGSFSGEASEAASPQTRGAFSGLSILFGIKNVFNSAPPFDAFFAPYYYSPFGDARLRSYWLSISKDF